MNSIHHHIFQYLFLVFVISLHCFCCLSSLLLCSYFPLVIVDYLCCSFACSSILVICFHDIFCLILSSMAGQQNPCEQGFKSVNPPVAYTLHPSSVLCRQECLNSSETLLETPWLSELSNVVSSLPQGRDPELPDVATSGAVLESCSGAPRDCSSSTYLVDLRSPPILPDKQLRVH